MSVACFGESTTTIKHHISPTVCVSVPLNYNELLLTPPFSSADQSGSMYFMNMHDCHAASHAMSRDTLMGGVV